MDDITWVKSSRSEQLGACVEAAPIWRKSSRSQGGSGDCVEVVLLEK